MSETTDLTDFTRQKIVSHLNADADVTLAIPQNSLGGRGNKNTIVIRYSNGQTVAVKMDFTDLTDAVNAAAQE